MTYIVEIGRGERRAKALAWLKEQGYIVSAHLFEEDNLDCVFIDYKTIFGGAPSIFALASSRGGTIRITWEEWLKKQE